MVSKYLVLNCSIVLCAVTVLVESSQQVLTLAPNSLNHTGTLQRFTLEPFHNINEIISETLSHDLDIWRITQSHVDIYFPSIQNGHEEPLPPSLASIPRTISPVHIQDFSTDRSSSPADQWNLSSLSNTSYHSTYHPLREIDSFVHGMALLYPNEASVFHLGHSAEGREMLGLKLARVSEKKKDGKPNKGPDRPGKERALDPSKKLGFVVVGAQHAREWVATATALYLAHALVSNNKTEEASLSHLLDTFDFYIIPTPNPDGYAYTWQTDRFWYKNRQIMGPNARCTGLDMNRNWGYKWKAHVIGGGPNFSPKEGTANYDLLGYLGSFLKKHKPPKEPVDPCSHWYPGHRPFEAPEVNNIANYMTTLPNLVGFVDLRSYGQMLSLPYSYSCKKVPKDAEDMMEAALGAAKALRNVHGTEFLTGTLCEHLYKAPGNVIDWMYKMVGIKYTYAVHLRDTGTYGFSLPAQWIRPVGEETGSMIAYLAKFIAIQMKRT